MTQGRRSIGPCAVEGCDSDAKTRGWCLKHYMRWWKTGDPTATSGRTSTLDPNRATCSVAECDLPFVTKGMCERHYSTNRRLGSPTAMQYEWAAPTPCKACGDPPGGRFRQFCSTACRNAWLAYDGQVPTSKECVSCGTLIHFFSRDTNGQRRYRARSWCGSCNRRHRRYGATVKELADRDGLGCALCGCVVDINLKRSDSLMCPSIDHVVPIARGGQFSDPANLQLTHLLCNMRKGARYQPLLGEATP